MGTPLAANAATSPDDCEVVPQCRSTEDFLLPPSEGGSPAMRNRLNGTADSLLLSYCQCRGFLTGLSFLRVRGLCHEDATGGGFLAT